MSEAPGRLRALFLAAHGLAPREREAFLLRECPDDEALRAEVRALLAAVPLPDHDVAEVLIGADSRAAVIEPGARFGRFTLLEHLGAGGMGRVDRAFDPRSQRQVAIKRLRAEWLANPAAVARFEREVFAASRLEARGLCPVYEVGDIEGVPYFVMPVVRGETLDAQLRRATGSPDAAAVRRYAAMFEKVARALHHAHEAGLVHRDVKPGNLMIQPDGEPIVLDFGLAQDGADTDPRLTRTGEHPGTPAYMAPEQVAGGLADRRTDVYALGIALFECVCGSRPFAGESSLELFANIRKQPLPAPRQRNRAVSADLAVVLEVATDKDPERRYSTAEAMADDLARVEAGQPVRARRQSAIVRARRWLQRNRLASAVLAALAIAFGAVLLLQLQRDSINESLRGTIRSEQQARAVADGLRQAAQERLDDFEALATLRETGDAVAAERDLCPPWPERVAALEGWLADHGSRMPRNLGRIDDALARLGGRDRGAPDRETRAAAAATLQRRVAELDLRIAVLRRAIARRLSSDPVDLPKELPPDAPRDFDGLLAAAWSLVDPERPAERYGKEWLGFQYAMATVDLADTDLRRAESAHALLWAMVATGVDCGRPFVPMAVAVLDGLPGPASDPDRYRDTVHQADAARLAARGELEACEEQRAALVARIAGEEAIGAPNSAERVLADRLLAGRRDLAGHLGPAGLRQRVEWNLEWAKRIDALTVAHPRARATWQQAADAIARADGETASRSYAAAAIDLKPVTGLVPIGMNPVTRLWEFYHLRSAFDPRRGGDPADLTIPVHRADGSIDLQEGDGIVFVLLPGGHAVLGDQGTDPRGPNYFPHPRDNEHIREVDLAPYFLARHELTQAQWLRLTLGENPSEYAPGKEPASVTFTLLHPVERVSPRESGELLRRHGLRLPTEWEWEYACRAGTTTPWSCGAVPGDVLGHFNIAEPNSPGAVDGYFLHAPVGSFAANPFGFFDMHGNVAEPCSDLDPGQPSSCIERGGQFARAVEISRSSYRSDSRLDERDSAVGVRAARSLR